MKVTNNFGLPEAYVRAVVADPYHKGHADFSVTELLKPARATALEHKFREQLEEDAITRVFALLGHGTHRILERSARPDIDLVEKRFFKTIGLGGKKFVVSGQIDLLERDSGTLSDWKVTKAYKFSKKAGGGKDPNWIAQMNMQLELLRHNGLDARTLRVVAILRDWNAKKVNDSSGYPSTEIVCVDLPIWERTKTQAYMDARIVAHVIAREELPQCSAAETWGGNRCKSYCSASKVCTQYQEMLKTGLINNKKE